MGANKTKLNKGVLRQLVQNTQRKNNKSFLSMIRRICIFQVNQQK